MNKEQQDLAWKCLPKEARNHIRSDYEYYLKRYEAVNANTAKGAIDALEDLFGHHNLTSDTEPEEVLMVERKKVQELYANTQNIVDPTSKSYIEGKLSAYRDIFGDKCQPDKEETCMCVHANGTACKHYDSSIVPNGCTLTSCKFESKFPTEQPSIQVEPKFKYNIGDLVTYKGKVKKVLRRESDWSGAIMYTCSLLNGQSPLRFEEEYLEPYTEPKFEIGDKVRLNFEQYKDGEYDTIDNIVKSDYGVYLYHLKNDGDSYAERYLEPYTEPETKDMEEKELNLMELLEGCEGEELYNPCYGKCILKAIHKDNNNGSQPLISVTLEDGTPRNFSANGKICWPVDKFAPISLFPYALYEKYPLDAYSAWMEWKEARKPKYSLEIKFYPFKDGKMLMSESEEFELQVHSLEEAHQAAEAVRETLMKFHKQNQKK